MSSFGMLEMFVRILGVVVFVYATFLLVTRRLDPTYRRLAALALLGHIVVALFLPQFPWDWDIEQFHTTAVMILNGQTPGDARVGAFATFQALVYATFGRDPLFLSLVNGLLAVLVAVPASDVARHLYPRVESTNGVAAVVLFLPGSLLFLTVPMRDALGVLLFFVVLAATVRLIVDGSIYPFLLAVPLLGMLRLFRPELYIIFLVGVVAAIAVEILERTTGRQFSMRSLFVLGAPLGFISLRWIIPKPGFDRIIKQLTIRSGGSAMYLDEMAYETWNDLIVAAPVRSIYFQFAPFPLHVSNAVDLFAVLILPLLVILTVAALRSAARCERHLVALVFLVVVYLVGIVGYGAINTNYGTTMRHRIPFTFLLCVFAAPVLERWTTLLRERIGE